MNLDKVKVGVPVFLRFGHEALYGRDASTFYQKLTVIFPCTACNYQRFGFDFNRILLHLRF